MREEFRESARPSKNLKLDFPSLRFNKGYIIIK